MARKIITLEYDSSVQNWDPCSVAQKLKKCSYRLAYWLKSVPVRVLIKILIAKLRHQPMLHRKTKMRRNVSIVNTRHHLKQLTIVFALAWRNTCWLRAGSNPRPPSRTSCEPARCCARSGRCRCSRAGWPVGGRPPVSCQRSLENVPRCNLSKMTGPGDSNLRAKPTPGHSTQWRLHAVPF